MINVSNRLLRESDGETQPTVEINTTGQTTANSLLSMSSLIADHAEPVPNVIDWLFGCIIHARSLVSSTFQQLMGALNSDDELKRSIESHQHVIKTLQRAFEILGGKEWEKTPQRTDDTEDVEELLFASKFDKLAVEQDGESSDEENDEPSLALAAAREVARKPKGKKIKKYKKRKKGRKQDTQDTAAIEVPIESIRIIEDTGEVGVVTDYLLTIYSTVTEWADLRAYTQVLWREVAYEYLNSVITRAVNDLTTSMVKKINAAIFVDFPGRDTYKTIINTVTRDIMDKAQGKSKLMMNQLAPDGTQRNGK